MLPGRSGLDICRVLRESDIKTPILVLTAKDNTVDKVLMLNQGADDYLTKPFSLIELVARLRAILRRPETVLPVELINGPLRLHPGFHRVFLNEEELQLPLRSLLSWSSSCSIRIRCLAASTSWNMCGILTSIRLVT